MKRSEQKVGRSVRETVLQVIFMVGIACELAAETRDSVASQVPPIAPGTDEMPRKDGLDRIKLLSIGPKAVPALADALLTSPEKATRIAAASTLVELLDQSDQKPLIFQRLDQATADPEEAMRQVAVKGLGRMGPMAKPALVHLVGIVKSDPSESGPVRGRLLVETH